MGAEGEELGMSIANPFFGVTDRDARSARISGFGRVRRIPRACSPQCKSFVRMVLNAGQNRGHPLRGSSRLKVC